jgi:aryl-alcohol dehydrogenase-like predicted oxidoreductase
MAGAVAATPITSARCCINAACVRAHESIAMASQVPRIALGSCGLTTPRIALGTMGMTAFYNQHPEATEEESLRTIAAALALGIDHLDTAWVYRNHCTAHHNEELVGKALAIHGRERFTVATKFLPAAMDGGATEANIRSQLSESLSRLGTSYVDLYYMHRVCDKVAPASQFSRRSVTRSSAGAGGGGGGSDEQTQGRRTHPIRRAQRVHTRGAAAFPRRLPRLVCPDGVQRRLP